MIEFPPKKIISSIPATWDGLRYFPGGGGLLIDFFNTSPLEFKKKYFGQPVLNLFSDTQLHSIPFYYLLLQIFDQNFELYEFSSI